MSYRGIIKSAREAEMMWVVWMTESSPIGEGIIGIYDCEFRLRDIRITRPIKHISVVALNKEIDVIVVREVSATGTGLYEETMSVLDVPEMNVPLWSEKVYSWVEGPTGDKGHLLQCVVFLLDIDSDGTKELVITKLEQDGTDLFKHPYAESVVLSFDSQNHRFSIQKEGRIQPLYPLPSEEKDNF
jgi:hypothetical protein